MRVRNWLNSAPYWIAPGLLAVKYLLSEVTHAQSSNVPTLVTNVNNLQTSLWCPIIGIFFWVVIALSVIMALWAAYTYVTASDDTEKTTKARKILTYAVIGIIVALIANGFPALVGSLFPSVSSSSFVECPSSL